MQEHGCASGSQHALYFFAKPDNKSALKGHLGGMNTMKIQTWAAVAVACVAQGMFVPPVAAQSDGKWGPWYSTQCRPVRINSPLGGRNIEQPQVIVPDKGPTQECKWERRKSECPKTVDRLKKPIKCFNRFQKKGWSVQPPRN
jgi:hypothetical protein